MRKPYQVRAVIPRPNGGFPACVHCGTKALREALFRGDGIIIIEKYCEDCLQTERFSALMSMYAMNE